MKRVPLNLSENDRASLNALTEALANPGQVVRDERRKCSYRLIQSDDGRLLVETVRDDSKVLENGPQKMGGANTILWLEAAFDGE